MQILTESFHVGEEEYFSSDIRNGFVLKFPRKPTIDLPHLEEKIKEEIDKELDIAYLDDKHIVIGDKVIPCDGPRFHVRNTREIVEFSIYKELIHDPKSNTYCLIGLVDSHTVISRIEILYHFLTRDYPTTTYDV